MLKPLIHVAYNARPTHPLYIWTTFIGLLGKLSIWNRIVFYNSYFLQHKCPESDPTQPLLNHLDTFPFYSSCRTVRTHQCYHALMQHFHFEVCRSGCFLFHYILVLSGPPLGTTTHPLRLECLLHCLVSRNVLSLL